MLELIVARWQERLGLRDWTVTVAYAKPFALGQQKRVARIEWEIATRHARIEVLDPRHVPADIIAPYDVEESVVHELLHLHFAAFNKPVRTPKGMAQEQAINAIAHALVSLATKAENARA